MADTAYQDRYIALQQVQSSYLDLVRRRRMYGGILLIFFVAMMASGFDLAQSRNAGGFIDGLPMVFSFPAEVLSEAWEKRANIPGMFATHFPSLIETINIAAVSTLLGGLAAMVLALLSTRGLSRWPALTPVFRRLMDACRAIPEIVIALMLIYILGGGPVPAVAAIALHTAGALGKLFSEVAENADLKPVEGLASVGASWGQRMFLGIIPQVAPNWLSYALMRFEINVRASAILGFVGSGGIGYDLKIAMQWGQGRYDEVVAIFLLLFVTIVAIDRLSDYARARLVKGRPA
ncbi:MAG TPA: phosphonate ABC transporter, permease protein PhnE [Paracoccus sp. (in: a-proteobacteria)]|uniref:phosphonate ABC transporter, permease protein PhnE n=1 Tax=Paracoccus sp. TaxID=267 RepID=UPI002C35EDD4|nr:phosphonate ABC transporter, permease protein PhnE [Paracoccus sp. (in: a-proteobacteria)]HWL57695.1 phosphonate ABC transporter, permease protein PhnE [Paracoccus sp. (in: a-proteobacteria)]